MPKVIGISAIVGFFLSLPFLAAVSFYAIALRAALFKCRQTHAGLAAGALRCRGSGSSPAWQAGRS